MKTTTTHDARAAHTTNAFAPAAGAEGSDAGPSNATAPKWRARAYERFLGLPVWLVLAVMWVAGAAILGTCVLVVYVVGSVLLQALAGSS